MVTPIIPAQRVTVGSFRRACQTLRERSGLALAKGVNAAIVSRRLGHATVAFTLDIYSHVLPQVDAEAAEFIAAFGGREN